MGFDPLRGRRPWRRLQSGPGTAGSAWYARLGTEQYARAGALLALAVLVIALVAVVTRRGGNGRQVATPTTLAVRASATVVPAAAAKTPGVPTPESRQAEAPATEAPAGEAGVGRDFFVRLEPGFPGGVRSEEQVQLLLATPGFPGGVQTETPLVAAAPPRPPSVAGGPPAPGQPAAAATPASGFTPGPAVNVPTVSPPAAVVPPPVAFNPPPVSVAPSSVETPVVPAPVFETPPEPTPTPGAVETPTPQAPPPATMDAMTIGVAVRAYDSDELFSSPSVRIYAGNKLCTAAAADRSLVVKATVAAGCGKPGDLLTFEAGGQDARNDQPTPLTPACAYELVFGGRSDPVPAYAPVTFAPGERFVPLILSALPGCPLPGATPAQPPEPSMTLTLSIVDPARPDVPLTQPSISVLVGGVPCAREASLDTPAVVLVLPKACGTAGAPLSFLVSARDPRFSNGGQLAACAVDPPPTAQPSSTQPASGQTPTPPSARSYQPLPKSVTFQPGQSATYGLLPSDAPCPGTATPTPTVTPSPTPTAASTVRTPTPAAPATPSPSPTPSPTPTPVPVHPPEFNTFQRRAS